MKTPLRILFLCTGNSCRSQMAEGWARKLHPAVMEAFSAGTHPGRPDPRAVRVMAEAGVDISEQRPKHASDLRGPPFDWVVTVCDSARESCPVLPGAARYLHESFEDPPVLAATADNEDEALAIYRRVRDEIRAYVETLPALLQGAGPA